MPDSDKKSPSVKFRDFRGTKGQVDDADNARSPTPRIAGKKEIRPGASAVNSSNVMRTEREPAADEGTRAFGAPLSTPHPLKRTKD